MTDKMAILGEGDSVLAFKASGVDAYYASDREQAKDILRKLAKEYAVIFITEALAAQTVLFQRGADRFSRIAQKFMGRPMKAEVLARLICRAALANHPRLIYHKHRNVGLVLLGALPIRLQCAVIKLLLR